ncbi:MAG: hypothetical protein D6718_13700 [Acidobacteria bacterium]|nr:MAG: hypothetical protein D6718_13700 [Acidobacteriota bacterium]
MTISLLEPLLRSGRHGRGSGGGPSGACPHCGAREDSWPVAGSRETAPFVCVACGGLVGPDGEALRICPACAFPEPAAGGGASCRGAERLDGPAAGTRSRELALEAEAAAADLFELREEAALGRYLAGVREQLEGEAGPVRFIDMGEPAVATLPGGLLLVSLGLLATLEDEAQLAFVLAREAALERAGWVWRRFAAAARSRRGWLAGWTRGGRSRLADAIELSLFVGYGSAAEQAADREGLAALVRAGYDPEASVRALRAMESATLAGRGARFLLGAERATWLAEGSEALGRTDSARLNREVYRRVVGGFNVFGR